MKFITEVKLLIGVAFLVLLFSLYDQRISTTLSVMFMLFMAVYKLYLNKKFGNIAKRDRKRMKMITPLSLFLTLVGMVFMIIAEEIIYKYFIIGFLGLYWISYFSWYTKGKD